MLADTVAAYFRDLTAGTLQQGDQNWSIRLSGSDQDQEFLANIPIPATGGEIPLRSVADIVRTKKSPTSLVLRDEYSSVMLAVYKETEANVIEIADTIETFANAKNKYSNSTGIEITILDDRTDLIRSVLRVLCCVILI